MATVEDASSLNLTLKPSTAGFSIIPFVIDLPVGVVNASFRISIPQNFFTGKYSITWETLNDDIPPNYTPIKETTINVI